MTGGKGDRHDYKVKLNFEDRSYEGCGNKVDNFLVPWRSGNFANFIKKIGYTYQWDRDPKNLRYDNIETHGDLLAFTVTWEAWENTNYNDYEENWEYFVLGKTDEGWTTYWQGNYPVHKDSCEKYVEVPWLMDFNVFNSCPRG